MKLSLRTLFTDVYCVLAFKRPSAALTDHWPAYLAFGLCTTWLVGIGRYWDNPRAAIWQHWGLGSLIYVFCLALVIWLIALPLRPREWTYRNVLLFLTLTSPPALLYAIPVEQFMSLSSAQNANVLFLFVVAAWRVALLVRFLRVFADLSGGAIFAAAALPLALIVSGLTYFNLEHVVFELMAGNHPDQSTGNDGAFLAITALSIVAVLSLPVVLIVYVALVFDAWRGKAR